MEILYWGYSFIQTEKTSYLLSEIIAAIRLEIPSSPHNPPSKSEILSNSNPPCVQGVEYALCFCACRMKRLKGCPDVSASTAKGLRRPPV